MARLEGLCGIVERDMVGKRAVALEGLFRLWLACGWLAVFPTSRLFSFASGT